MAWRIPLIWKGLEENALSVPKGSTVPEKQKLLLKTTREVFASIAADVRGGLLETVGVESALSMDEERCSIVLELPAGTDTKLIARAIDAENIESWCDSNGKVHIGINPWYSIKDVDQTVLCTIKVIHVLLGIHAADTAQPKTFGQKLLASMSEVMVIKKNIERKKD